MDHLEALERLGRLHAQGSLTDEEFNSEKRRLLTATDEIENPQPIVETGYEGERTGLARWAWIIAVVIGGGALFLAWDQFGFGGHSALAGGQGVLNEIAGEPSQWTLAEEADPMTDERIVSAYRQIEADGFFIDTTITCQTSESILTYTLTAFDADNVAADFKQEFGGTTMNIVPHHNAQFRPDSDAPQAIKYSEPQYTNTFELAVPSIGEGAPEYIRNDKFFLRYVSQLGQLVSAHQLTVKLPLKQGNPIIRIDQTDETVASVIGQCAPQAIAMEEQRQTEPNRRRLPQTHDFTITERFTVTDSNSRTMSGLTDAGIGIENVADMCVGDKLIVQNQASNPVGLVGAIYRSDNFSDIGTVTQGASITLENLSEGEFVIFSDEFSKVRFRYNVALCS